MLKDERRTLRVNVRDEDDWKDHKDNWRTGNDRIPFKGPKWTGRTIFMKRTRKQYLSVPSVNACNLGTIPLKEMFFVGYVSSAISEGRGVRSVTLIIERKNGIGNKEYRFESNDEDFQLMGLIDKKAKEGEERGIIVTMQEIPDLVPRMVLLCSEETNWFTIMNTKRQEKYGRREGTGDINLLVVTITIHDDLNSDYGFHKASLSLRDYKDTMFFAGPCTGGSSWARLNRSKGPETEAIIEAKVMIFKQLWSRFEELFVTYYGRQIGIYMELPRGCEYWNNDEVKFMIEGTDSSIHDFDGCCYGLRQKFGDSNKYIKKPWRIVSWNVEVGNQLSLKCDGRHEHVPCAGRETLHTQIYTSKVVSIILEESNKRCSNIEVPSINACTAGSSGSGNKKRQIASPCVNEKGFGNKMNTVESIIDCFISQIVKQIHRTIVPTNKKSSKPKLRWTCSSLLKRGGNPKRGYSSSGATGAGRATRSDGHKSCPDAISEASGSDEEEEKRQMTDHHCLPEKTQMQQNI